MNLNLNDLYKRADLNLISGCLEWTGFRDPAGYSRVSFKGRLEYGHRVVWMMVHETVLTSDEEVLHKCDNPPCINIDHLFLGTQHDNLVDMVRKERRFYVGEDNPHAILTESIVLEIVKRNTEGESGRSLAHEFGVHKSTVYDILKGRRWSHTTGIGMP